MKFPEKANLERQKAEWLWLRAGSGDGIAVNGHKGTFWDGGSILKLGYSDGGTTV